MGDQTAIEWTRYSWSPWEGCQQVGPGCDNCYALALNRRWAKKGSAPAYAEASAGRPAKAIWPKGEGPNWGAHAPRRRASAASWAKVRGWDKAAAKAGRRETVFPSICDPFDKAVPIEWLADFLDLIRETPNLDWLLLTKRPGMIVKRFLDSTALLCGPGDFEDRARFLWPANAHIGCTVVNQDEADRDVFTLLDAKLMLGAPTAFLSVEPMLGPVNLASVKLFDARTENGGRSAGWESALNGKRFDPWGEADIEGFPKLDWVICGGESGPKARAMHPDWARGLRDQCAAAGVAFLFKQWGEWREFDSGGPTEQVDAGSDMALAVLACLDGKPGWVAPDGRFFTTEAELPDDDTPCRLVERVGKKAAGRLLDGVLHDARPAALTREAGDV